MKRILSLMLIVSLAFVLKSCMSTQKVPLSADKTTYEKILEFDESDKDDLYIKANSWFVRTFNSAESVIEFQDKESGKIMGKYVFELSEGMYKYDIKQTISIDIKEGKTRVILSDPNMKTTYDGLYGSAKYVNANYEPVYSEKVMVLIKAKWEELIQSLNQELKKDTSW